MTVFITGTDTDVGKTVVSAWCQLHLSAKYWKPIQCGLEPATDSERVAQLIERSDVIYPSVYELEAPQSPHEAAKREGVRIELEKFIMPQSEDPLIVEGAGGLLVPLNDRHYIIDLIDYLKIPVILVCRSTLGTINHTLLSIEALKQRRLNLIGVVVVGPKTEHNVEAIEYYGQVPILAEIPMLDPLNKEALLSIKPALDLLELIKQNSL